VNAPATPQNCPNCGENLADLPRPARFCPACGQEAVVKPPTLGEFVQQFGGAYLSTEGALWRTLKLLLFKPGELTRLYLAGRRKHYVLPLRLYLTISLVVLLAVRVVGGGGAVQINIDAKEAVTVAAENRNFNMVLIGGSRAGLREGVFYCENMPQWMCQRLQRRIVADPKEMARQVEELKERFLGNLGAAMFLLLPAFALWLKLAYLNRRMRYTEHLVFALHVHAFWFVAMALTLPATSWLSVPAFVAVPWYTMAAMRRVYGGRRWPRVLRAGFVSLLYLVTMSLALALVGLWSLFA
jgi:Protein of unknown function (DUF3667)